MVSGAIYHVMSRGNRKYRTLEDYAENVTSLYDVFQPSL
jgi:hypothetical protein